jgi:hypothetical protein
MNAYAVTLWALVAALSIQSFAAGLAFECFLLRGQPAAQRRIWLALAGAALLLALQHGYALELALRTGLYDLRQGGLASLAALCFGVGVFALRRRQA